MVAPVAASDGAEAHAGEVLVSFVKGVSRQALERAGIEVKPGDLSSSLEQAFAQAIHFAGLPQPQREVRCVPGREWRSDFVWPEQRVIFEIEGGTYSGGRHTRGKGFEEDCRKYNALTLAGWRVFRVTGAHIESGEALKWVEEALGMEVRP